MDDTAQQSGISQVSQDQQTQVPQQPVGNTQVQQDTPSPQVLQQQATVGIGGKEQEAVGVGGIQPSHPEIIVPETVAEAGVKPAERSEQEVQLTPEQKAAGIEPAKEATPLPQGTISVQLPDEYKEPSGFGLLHQNVKKAATWLWLLLFKAQKQSERITQTQQKK